MTIPLFHVDAFTDRPFAGNPAAVCILTEQRPDAWMQQVAAEMNLSETAYVHRVAEGYQLRWFTPATWRSWLSIQTVRSQLRPVAGRLMSSLIC